VLRGDMSTLLPLSSRVFTSTGDGFKIWGLRQERPSLLVTGGDLTVIPITASAIKRRRLAVSTLMPIIDAVGVRMITPPFVTDHSCDGAIWIISNRTFNGYYPYVVTGEVVIKDGRALLTPLPSIILKLPFIKSIGLRLLANDSSADLPVSQLSLVPK